MTERLAAAVVILFGLYLIGLGVATFLAPKLAERFLLGFATSATTHNAELVIRMIVGMAFVAHAPAMRYPGASAAFGWILVATTAVLFLVPWQWHHRFAEQAVPRMLRYLRLVGVVSLVFGGVVVSGAM